MAYLTALLIIDATASALNNSGEPIQNARTENTSSVKFITKRGGGIYPYVSAQAYRRWLRRTLEADPQGWQMSPVYREEKVAYTDANPLTYWDDDLLGYMRAPGTGASAKKARQEDPEFQKLTPMGEEKSDGGVVTRLSPLRVSTLVAVAPVYITNDFGVMARQEGDPAPFEHQFYKATLQGMLSLSLSDAGTFTYSRRTGYQNLDSVRRARAEQQGLQHIPERLAYRLPIDERVRRVRRLVEAIPLVQGGAKQTLHYTDVSPVVTIAAVTHYGNHPFNYLITEQNGELFFRAEAFGEVIEKYRDQFRSPVCVGWKPGFAPEQAQKLDAFSTDSVYRGTPIEVFQALSEAIGRSPEWLE